MGTSHPYRRRPSRDDDSGGMEKPLPSDLHAERAVLGSLLLDRDSIILVAPLLKPEMFYMERHAQIYAAALRCYDKQIPPDLVTIAAALGDELAGIGGPAYLIELSNSVPTAMHVEYYAQVVITKARMRLLLNLGGKVAGRAFDSSLTPEEIIAELDQETRLILGDGAAGGLLSAKEIADMVFNTINRAQENGGMFSLGVKTGIPVLDSRWRMLENQKLTIIAARPAEGKSALAQQIGTAVAEEVQAEEGIVCYFTLEMTYLQMAGRYLAQNHGITGDEFDSVLRGKPSDEYLLQRVNDGLGVFAALPLFIDETKTLTVADIRRRCLLRAARHGKVRLIIVDYLQLVKPEYQKGRSREQEISEISRALVRLAGELDCSVLALAQVSREAAKGGGPPQLYHLRESGALEQDAFAVSALYWPGKHDDEQPPDKVELHMLKHRDSTTGVEVLKFDGPRVSFERWPMFQAVEGF